MAIRLDRWLTCLENADLKARLGDGPRKGHSTARATSKHSYSIVFTVGAAQTPSGNPFQEVAIVAHGECRNMASAGGSVEGKRKTIGRLLSLAWAESGGIAELNFEAWVVLAPWCPKTSRWNSGANTRSTQLESGCPGEQPGDECCRRRSDFLSR
jgi:hypothetical protein